MISSNTRASRSRYSSPAQPLDNSRDPPNDSSRSFMQRWLEPSVQSKASFEEAGLMRYGVLESMAPLGTLPKPKKAGNENGQQSQQPQHHEKQHQPVRKIILRPSGTQQPASDDGETSAPRARLRAPSPPAPSASPPPTSAPSIRRVIITRDADDADHAPKDTARGVGAGAGAGAGTGVGTAARTAAGASAGTEAAATEGASGAGAGTGNGAGLRRRQSRRVSLPTSKPKHPRTETPTTEHITKPVIRAKPATPPKRVRRREPMDREFADKVVEAAVEEALKHYRYPTAWALRTLYDEKSGDADFVAMVEDVFKQTADAETMEEFSKLIEDKKREGKQDNQGCYYFVPPSTNNRFTPRKPRPAPYGKLLLRRPQSHEEKCEGRAAKKAKFLHSTTDSPRDKKIANGAKGHHHHHHHHGGSIRTPSRRRTRRDSGSSESSLSSAMSLSSPDGTEDDRSPSRRKKSSIAIVATTINEHDNDNDNGNDGDDDDDEGQDNGHRRSGGSGGNGAAIATAPLTGGRSQSDDAPNSRPITSTTRRKVLASNKQARPSNASEPTSPTNIYPSRARTSSSKADANMPGKVASSNLVVGIAKESANGSNDQEAGSVIKARMPVEDEEDPFWNRRREAQKITNGYVAQESSMRDGEEDQEAASTPARRTRRTRHSLIAPITVTRSTRSASKKRPPNEDGDITVSPLAFSFNEGSSTVGSRAATPTTLRPTKKPRIGLRIKSSPVKKRGGTAAGVPRSMSEAQSVSASVSAGTPREQGSDNDEYCSACGNAGDVVCCDGCPRSFHFECVDMVQSDNLPDEWYCNECFVRRYPSRVPVYKGAFASALNNLEKSIPRAFSLPKRLQSRFEGVKAGADGDYEDITTSKTVRKRPGYDELPDFFKQREDGEAVLCHACQKPATEIRAIIPCNACPFHWHIDCLDPPLAMPPVLKTWRCPAHVDDILTEMPSLAPAHRYRRLKGGQLITPAFSRGVKNNGHIEIDWADEPERSSRSGWKDPESFGRTYKLPAQGVVLDFIEQLRQQGAGYGPRSAESRWVPYSSSSIFASDLPTHGSSLERRVDELQVSLNLVGLKQRRSENIDRLTSALLAAADDNVLALMAKGNADNFAHSRLVKEDKSSLRAMLIQMDAMRERIRELLGDQVLSTTSPPFDAGTPDTEEAWDNDDEDDEEEEEEDDDDDDDADDDDSAVAEKPDSAGPVTEPTPPSTVDHGEGTMELD